MRPFGIAPRQWPDAAYALQRHRDRPRRIDLHTRSTVPTSIPNSSDAVATSTRIWPSFNFFSAASRSLRDRLPWCAATFSSPMRSPRLMRHPLRHAPRIHKHQSRAVLLHQLRQPVVNLIPHLIRRHRPERHRRNLDRHVELAPVPDVHNHWIRPAAAGQKVRDLFDRLLRRRKSDAHRRACKSAPPAAPATSARCAPRLSSATA